MTQTNDFTNDSGEFEPAPPLLAASTPFPNSDLVEDDPRDIFSTISLAGDPDTPLSAPELSGADLAAQGLDAIRGVGPVGDIPRITTIPPEGPVTHLEEMSFVTPTLRMLSPKPIEGPLKVAGYSARPVEPPVGDISGGKEGVEAQIDLIGRYEAFLARVRSVHYVKTNGHPVARQHPVIDYQRVWSSYDTNHEPKVGIAGSSNSRPIPGVNFAYPFPLRHDQARYIVARDDVVTIIQGEDRAYYMVDELPFLAQVMSHVDVDYVVTARQDAPPAGPLETDRYLVGASGSGDWAGEDNKIATWGAGAWAFTATSNGEQVYASGSDNYWLKAAGTWSTTTNVTESNNGGAGNKTLRVIRKALTGVPGSTTVAGMSDLQDASSVDIEYEHVMVVGPSNSAHGYRVGDHVWVFKRGQYLFAMKTPKTFVAKLQVGASKDPTESLADFTTNHYWFKEQTPTIAYTDDKWTVTWNAVNAADPTGSGGRWGRWADAVNLAEGAAEHGLADGDLVIVSDVSDAASGEIGYVFSKPNVPSIDLTGIPDDGIVTYDSGTGTFTAVSGGSTGDILTQDAGGGYTPKAPSAAAFASGMIILWSGTIATIPTGWVLCNGDNSTPDLRDKFIVGAKQDDGGVAKSNVDAGAGLLQTGGNAQHGEVGTTGNQHSFSSNITLAGAGGDTVLHDGATTTNNPPWYALAYIMKT